MSWLFASSGQSIGASASTPVNPKGNQPSMFFGRTDAKGEVPILQPLDAKSQLIGKDPGVGKG